MTLTRRRFLTISAGLALAPGATVASEWTGRAFGADISMTLRAEHTTAHAALDAARTVIREIEAQFNLYDEKSPLSQLNAKGELLAPDPRFLELMNASDTAYRLTDGLFDPTVQRLWAILAKNFKPTEYFETVGWDRVHFDATKITLLGQSLTFNGIAQGYATDKVTEVLMAHGLTDVLVNIGEHRGVGGPWHLALQDPDFGVLGQRSLTTGAIATSSPNATRMGAGISHIIHPTAQPLWSTVSVEAASATLADSLSTAMVLAERDQIEAIRQAAGLTRVTLVDFDGNLTTL